MSDAELMPYQDRERVEEAGPRAMQPLGDGDFRVVLIEHGKTRNGERYYPQRALGAAAQAKLYDGAKMYLNHRDTADARRGHRDVKDWAATIKPGTVCFSGGALEAVAHVHDPAWRVVLEDELAKSSIGISQDATVKYRQRVIDGQPMHAVESIEAVHSVDFVPTGNAWGRVLEAYADAVDALGPDAEDANSDAEERIMSGIADVTLDVLEVERPDLVDAITARVRETLEAEAVASADEDVRDDEADSAETTAEQEDDMTDEQTVDADETAEPVEDEVSQEDAEQEVTEDAEVEGAEDVDEGTEDEQEAASDDVAERLAALEAENAALREKIARGEMTEAVREAVAAETGLTNASKRRVIEALSAGAILEGDDLTTRIAEACETERAHEVEIAKAIGGRTRVRDLGASVAKPAPQTEDAREAAREEFRNRMRGSGLSDAEIETLANAR